MGRFKFVKGAQTQPEKTTRFKFVKPQPQQPRPDIRQSDAYLNAQKQAQKYQQEAQKASSFRGMAGNTLKGLGSTALDFGKEIVRMPLTIPLKVTQTLAEAITKKPQVYTPQTKIEKFFYGDQPRQSYTQDQAGITKWGQEKGLGKVSSNLLGAGGAGAEILMDLLPAGYGGKALKFIKGSRAKAAEELSSKVASELSPTKTLIEGKGKTIRVSPTVKYREQEPLIQEARKYKSSEDLVNRAEKLEREMGREYPKAAGLKSYLEAIKKETNPKKIKELTEEFDSVIKQGESWYSGEKVKELEKAGREIYDIMLEKRRSIFEPIEKTANLDNAISYFKERASKFPFYKKAYEDLADFKTYLKNPERFGLYEETQFANPKQELNYLISEIGRKYKKEMGGMSIKGSQLEKILGDIKKDDFSLKTKSQLKNIWNKANTETRELAVKAMPELQEEGRAFSTRNKAPYMEAQSKKPTQKKALELSERFGEDFSFEPTVTKTATNVKDKINFVDFLRTPDRVMKKIGMENEMKLIRKQYDKYIKELPEEINKIDKWTSGLTQEENVNIFKHLDGESVHLSPKEQKVAGEIRNYLEEWADKLNLPKDKRISNYITHIFERDFNEKEFDEDLAKLINDNVAGSVYDPFTLKRLGARGYIQDTRRALEAYVKRATRKVNMDVALEEVKRKASKLELSQYNYVKNFVDKINLRPSDWDNYIDNTIKSVVGYKFGQRPFTVLSRAMRKIIYRGALGLNVSSTLKNLSQGANTFAKLGARYTTEGYIKLIKNFGSKELERVGVLADNFIQDKTLSTAKKILQKADKALFSLFETAEKINRGAAYYGAKAKAIKEGFSEDEAIDFAKKIVRDTQFTFGSIDTPPALQSDIGKTLGQFQSFSLKQAEFLTEMARNKEYAGLVRWMMASLGFVYGIGKSFGMSPKDLIPTMRIGVPPTAQLPYEAYKTIVGAPNEYGQPTGGRELLRAATPLIPAGVQGKKTFQGLNAYNQGYSGTASDRVRYPIEQGMGNLLRTGVFGQYGVPSAREYFNEDRSPLGEKQSQHFRETPREKQQAYYDKIIYDREIRKFDKAIKEAMKNKKVNEAEKIVKEKKKFIESQGQEQKKYNPFY